jgi:putative hydrolase
MLQNQGGFQWEQARAMAMQLATGGTSEPNPDPLDRIKLEQLARVAELHVAQLTGLSTSVTGRPVSVVPVTRAQWVASASDAFRPLFEQLGATLAEQARLQQAMPPDPDEDDGDPMSRFLEQIVGAAAPMLLSLMAGSLLGHLAAHSFGQYDLPIPRPKSDELVLVVANLDEFGEAWSLQKDDLLLWICLHEITHHAVLGVPHVRATLEAYLAEYAAGFTTTGGGLETRLGEMTLEDPNSLIELQQRFSDPEVLLGAIRSDAQLRLLPRLEALVAVIVGYVDWVMDQVGSNLVGSYGQLTEALRRRRVEADASDRFVEQLLGLEKTQAVYDRGTAFIAGVVERAGAAGLERLWSGADVLPTPAEVDAPGLWLARIDLPDAE